MGVPVGPMSTTFSPGSSKEHSRLLPPISSTMSEIKPAVAIDPGPGQGDPFHGQLDAIDLLRERFVVLQAIELAGMEIASGQRGTHHHLDDLMRQPQRIDHLGDELLVQRFGEHDPVAFAFRLVLGFLPGDLFLEKRGRFPDSRPWRRPSP